MKVSHSETLTLLAFFSAVKADAPVRVVATIPDQSLLQNVLTNSSKGVHPPIKDIEVTGFISKDGDIFELSESRGIGSIEYSQEPPPKSEKTMCRYGNIVVYSDVDCNTLIKSPQRPEEPANTEAKKEVKQKPLRKNKGGIQKPNNIRRNKNRKNNNQSNGGLQTNKRGNQVRRNLAKKKGVTTNRRRNNLKTKRGKNQQKKKNKQRNQRRRTNNNSKRKMFNNSQTRSREEPVRFTIF